MKFEEWEPTYREILADFGYSESEDEDSARLLISLLDRSQMLHDIEKALAELISGKSFLIIGPCFSRNKIGTDTYDALQQSSSKLVSVGEGTKTCLEFGIVPSMVFTDLDGFPAADVLANQKGAIVFIHAHGDNRPWLTEWVSRFKRNVVPTCQCRPFRGIYNWGGFTDGDRAYCALAHFGATKIELIGFDFSQPCGNKKFDTTIKMKKLVWARRIIEAVKSHPK